MEKGKKFDWSYWVNHFLSIPNLLSMVFTPVRTQLELIISVVEPIKRELNSNLSKNNSLTIENLELFIHNIQDNLNRYRYSNQEYKTLENNYLNYLYIELNKVLDDLNKLKSNSKNIPNNQIINNKNSKSENIIYNNINKDNIHSLVENITQEFIYNDYIIIFSNRFSEFYDRKITFEADLISLFLKDILYIISNPEYKRNFNGYRELQNYNEILGFLNRYQNIVIAGVSSNSKTHRLYDIIKQLGDRIFPKGQNYEEVFKNLLINSKYYPLQINMITGSTPTEFFTESKKLQVITHNLYECFEKITEILNTEPVFVEIGDAYFPGFIKSKAIEFFIQNIAYGLKQNFQNIMEMIGFIPSMAETSEEEDEQEQNEQYLIENDDLNSINSYNEKKLQYELSKLLEDNTEDLNNENNDIEEQIVEEKKGKKSSHKKKLSKKSTEKPSNKLKKPSMNQFIMRPDLVFLLKNHGLIIEKKFNGKSKYIPALNSETIFQLYISQVSINRKFNLDRQLSNKISAFFSQLIYYIFLLKELKKSQELTSNTQQMIYSFYQRNPLIRILDQLDIKIFLIARLKKLISYPMFLDLNYNIIDHTKVMGRDIFQNLGSRSEYIDQLIFDLEKYIEI